MTRELMRSSHIERRDAAKLVSSLTIWHPHGTIAPLDTHELNGIAYGDDSAVSGRSFHLASRIKTFTEKHEDGAMIDAVRARIRAAEKSVVLGFGNYMQNLELVQPNGPTKIKSIVGAGFRSVVRERLASWSKGRSCKIEVPNTKCAKLLNYYRMELSA